LDGTGAGGAKSQQTLPEGSLVNLTAVVTDPGLNERWCDTALDRAGEQWRGNRAVRRNNFSFTPHDNGTYQVTVVATDKDSASSNDQVVITVTNVGACDRRERPRRCRRKVRRIR